MAKGCCARTSDVRLPLLFKASKAILSTHKGRKGHKLMSMQRPPEQEVLLTPAEVAKMFRVDPKTVTRWAKAGKLTAIRTLGGHRRYRRSEVQALLGIDAKEARSV
jgi:excisionase family DNA binding protein